MRSPTRLPCGLVTASLGLGRRLAAHAARADHRHATVAQRVLVDREHRPVGVDAEQHGRLGAVELGERDEFEPPAGDPQPAVAGDDGARAGVRALLRQPLGIASPRVPARSSAAPVNAFCTPWTLEASPS